jgi:phage tail-like protein
MGTPTQLPPAPGPPHDPYWWLLDGRAGWNAQELVSLDKNVLKRGLRLALEPNSGRFLAETSGSFGGLTLPRHVTWGPEGSLYLLDAKTARLKVFDSCECRFDLVPCLGGEGSGPREFRNPHGIAVSSDTLYVCDTQNHRLALFSLRGFLLRADWRPPADARLDYPWEPYDVAFDSRGLAYVCDIANHVVHRFNRRGHWLEPLTGYSQPSAVAVASENRLYVLDLSPRPRVVQSMSDGTDRTVVERPAAVANAFPVLAVTVDFKGRLDLGSLCGSAHAWFDTSGEPIRDCEAQALATAQNPVFEARGHYLSGPLDSGIYQCQWHRIVLQGTVPTGTRIRLKTYTAETLQPPSHIMALGEEVWKTQQLVTHLQESPWDCLISSHRGRFLWLKLELESNGQVTPEVQRLRIEFPRISLRRYLPAVFGEDPTGADFTDRFLSLFDTTLRTIESQVDNQAALLDPMATPAEPGNKDFLNWLAGWMGLTLDRHWPLEKRRLLLKRAAAHFSKRGTRAGLHELLVLYMGMEPENLCCPGDMPQQQCCPRPRNCAPEPDKPCHWRAPPLILEHYQLRRWLYLCEGRLGDQAVLWGRRIVNRSQLDEGTRQGATRLIKTQDPLRDPFHVYAHKFSVFVPARFGRSEHHRKALRNIIESEKPAHTFYQLIYVEPRFRIGFQSSIGLDAVVGRYPEGVTLDGAPLGRATVLRTPANERGGPSLEIGVEARVGLTTQLN